MFWIKEFNRYVRLFLVCICLFLYIFRVDIYGLVRGFWGLLRLEELDLGSGVESEMFRVVRFFFVLY